MDQGIPCAEVSEACVAVRGEAVRREAMRREAVKREAMRSERRL